MFAICSSNQHSWLFTQRSWKLHPHKNLRIDVYSSFIYNSWNLEVTKMSFNRWMNKKIVTMWTVWQHPDNGTFSTKNKCANKPWKDTEKETLSALRRSHYGKVTYCMIPSKWHLGERQNCGDSKTISDWKDKLRKIFRTVKLFFMIL